jgi:hypothetical protein
MIVTITRTAIVARGSIAVKALCALSAGLTYNSLRIAYRMPIRADDTDVQMKYLRRRCKY